MNNALIIELLDFICRDGIDTPISFRMQMFSDTQPVLQVLLYAIMLSKKYTVTVRFAILFFLLNSLP